ncbi:MAG: DUF3641 domain-containing protein [Planctomycetes bacterium]|nr:DUF3641 domain-containing protein [Planctomycetota bacterium]
MRDAYKPATLPGLMCRTTLSADHEGRLYDYDFNLALGIPLCCSHVPSVPLEMRSSAIHNSGTELDCAKSPRPHLDHASQRRLSHARNGLTRVR